MKELKSVKKSILLGGALSGILSLIPVVNLFNIFFMFWMGVGGAVTVYVLKKENDGLKNLDASLTGAASGLTGGAIFAFFSLVTVLNISEAKTDRIISLAEKISTILKEDVSSLIQEMNLRMFFLLVIALALLFSIITGAVGGLISGAVLFRNGKNPDGGNHDPQ